MVVESGSWLSQEGRSAEVDDFPHLPRDVKQCELSFGLDPRTFRRKLVLVRSRGRALSRNRGRALSRGRQHEPIGGDQIRISKTENEQKGEDKVPIEDKVQIEARTEQDPDSTNVRARARIPPIQDGNAERPIASQEHEIVVDMYRRH